MIRKVTFGGALLIFAACSRGKDGVGPGSTASVVVTAAPTQIDVNGTAQASAVVKDENGKALTGKTITWTSFNPSVATVSSAGVIKGVAAGTATIQGSVEGVNGTATILVIAPVSACNAGLTTVDLPVGGVSVLSAAATQGCIKVPAATSAPADYLVVAANTNPALDIVGDYVFKSDEGETVPSTNLFPSNSILGEALAGITTSTSDLGATQLSFETHLRQFERNELNLPDAQRSYRGKMVESDVRYSVNTAIPAVGESTTFKVPAHDSSCTKFTTITAQVKYVNDKAIIYNDVASPAGGFTAADYQQIGDEFSNLIYPTDVSYFGTPLDLDNNGGRIIILYTPEVNKLTPANSGGFVGGFFFVGDFFPSSSTNQQEFVCKQSNVAELFYVLAPDPDGSINNNRRSTATVRQGTRGTIAHEFQHMLNASERIRSPIVQDFEEVWLDEGLAHFAEDAVGRAIRGIGEAENAPFARTLGGSADDFNAFFFQNFARWRIYLQNPGPTSPASTLADSGLAARGAAWSLLHYAADQYAPGGDVKAYIKKLAGGPDAGIVNLTKNAGNVPFATLIAGWLIANYADDGGIPGLSSLYSYKVYDMRSNEVSLPSNAGAYPLKVNNIAGTGFVLTGQQARSGSGNYFFASRNAGAPARTFRFLNPDGISAAGFTNATWIVVRTR